MPEAQAEEANPVRGAPSETIPWSVMSHRGSRLGERFRRGLHSRHPSWMRFSILGGGLLEISGTSPEPSSPAIGLVLQVRDIGATHLRLIEQRVAVDAEPEQKPWGLIEMTVRDPDGLALIIVEVPPEHPRRRG
jgi:hypothetical protein